MPDDIVILRSDRLVLRQWRDTDLDGFARMAADPRVMAYLLPLPDRAASDAAARMLQAHIEQYGFGFWAIEVPGVCPFIGFAGLKHARYTAHFTPAVEIGWRLDAAHWGRGYATEAARLALQDGFERLGLGEIVAVTVPANQRSRNVMARLGMVRAATDDFDHPLVADGHPLKRHVLYRLGREDWRASQAARP